ncbi:glycosyltransferase [Nitrincola sp.]|uniref:glycosyltransferase family 4 protein n=1 Tax=Nitrincola sp. TaxID=1926584 RepID=UPI003A91DCB8
MRIVIDLQSCQSGSRHGGIGRYSMNLVQGMLRNSNGHDIHIVLSSLMRSGDAEIYDSLDGLISKDNIHICDVVGPVFELDPNNTFRARSSELLREYFISKLSPDIVFVTSLFEGLGDNAVVSVSRLLSGIPTVVILYDLIPLVESETYLSDARAKTHYYRKLDDLSRADILLSISEYSRFEALQELGLHPDKVENISSAIDAKFRKIDVSEAANKKLQDKYGFSKDFILYTGSFDQRKNHEYLIKAYSKLPNEVCDKYQLVIVGNGWDGVYDRLKSVGLSAGLSEGDLIFVGKVEDEELLMLYNLCFLFVFPSLREGFGLPVLEAMSCGVPVIGSNATSIPEVIGNEKALFDPYSVDSISSKMLEVLTNASLRAELVEAGLIQAKKFSWDLSAKVALAACERLFASLGEQKRLAKITCNDLMNEISNLPSAQEATSEDIAALSVVIGDLFVESGVQEGKDLSCSKIGLVTPWNTKCGIAMYSKYLISNELDEYVVFAPSAQGVAFTDESNVRRCWEVGGERNRSF